MPSLNHQFLARYAELGNVMTEEDNNGQVLTYNYHGSGQLSSVSLDSKQLVSIGYDENGRQQSMTDIDAGTITYDYNAFGELANQTDARGNTFILQYDNLGRIQYKNSSTLGNATYEYYTDNNKAYHGLLKSVSRTDNMQQKYVYDNLGRLTTYTDVIQGEEFNTKYGYDAYGNNILKSYPSGFIIENRYNEAGYLYDILNVAGSKSIWKLQETDVYGAVRKVLNGNGLQTSYEYDSYGALTEIKTGNIQYLTYTIDPTSRSLISERKDMKKNMTEGFGYDSSNRMKSVQLNSGALKSMEYSNNGNINTKYDNGAYQYNAQKIHAVTAVIGGYDSSNQTITYNALNKTSTIVQGNIQYDFKYGTDGERRKMQRRLSGTLNLDRTYSHNYLKETIGANTKETHYIPTPTGVSAIFVKENGNAGNMYYLCSDHLGSITDVVNASGSVVESFSYDPWGRRRSASNWNDYNVNTGSNSLVSRGYTGHEHLDDVGLINMNGRMYDPLLGRMLSPDNQIPNPFSPQGYNRYSYVFNNPMSFTDPDGENPFAWIAAGAIALFKLWYDGKKANDGQSNPFKWDWKNANYTIGYSSSGNTAWGSVGWNNDYGVAVGYNSQQGWGAGMNQNGSTSIYYPQYENRVNNAIEQNANNAVDNARQDYFSSGLAVVGLANSGYGNIQRYNAMDLATSLERSSAWNPAHAAAYERELLNAKVANLKSYYAGKVIGVVNAGYIWYQWDSGQISTSQMLMEQGSNVIVTRAGGAYGIAWTVGWEGGRQITHTNWYQEIKFNFWRNRMETLYGPPSESNKYLWDTFYYEYFRK